MFKKRLHKHWLILSLIIRLWTLVSIITFVTVQDPSVLKSNQLHVMWSFSFTLLIWDILLKVPLKWLIIVPKSWTSIGYFSNSTRSSASRGRVFPFIGDYASQISEELYSSSSGSNSRTISCELSWYMCTSFNHTSHKWKGTVGSGLLSTTKGHDATLYYAHPRWWEFKVSEIPSIPLVWQFVIGWQVDKFRHTTLKLHSPRFSFFLSLAI